MFKNFKNVSKVAYGRGTFGHLDDILAPHRDANEGFMLFVVDAFFKDKSLARAVPLRDGDVLYYANVDAHEPTTEQVDSLRDEILEKHGLPAGIIGIGGGSVMDIAKAGALMFTNEGSSTLYQGLNLVKKPGIYHAGVPTLSGTGAEVSMTAVLTGPEKKLGLKCDWTVFDQVVLDPDLISDVPRNQWFYTGMDDYIHCVEALDGQFKNAYSRAYAYQSMELCRDIFLRAGSGQTPENDEKLMVASYMGGLALTYSEVGVCHALSYGLSYVFGTRHGLANCIVFDQLEDYYPEGVQEFKQMVEKHQIDIPKGLAKGWTEDEIEKMIDVAMALSHMWRHALGEDWEKKLTREELRRLYRKM